MKPHALLAKLNELGGKARHRPPRPGREPLRRHEVPRLLRNPGRHHPAACPPRHRVDHPRPRSRPPQDDLMPRYASMIYTATGGRPSAGAAGLIDTPSRPSMAGFASSSTKGNVIVVSPDSEDRFPVRSDHRHLRGRPGAYNQKDATASSASTRCACASRPTRKPSATDRQAWTQRAVHVRADHRRSSGTSPSQSASEAIAYMVFIIGHLAWESKAGNTAQSGCSSSLESVSSASWPRASSRGYWASNNLNLKQMTQICPVRRRFRRQQTNVLLLDGKCVSHSIVLADGAAPRKPWA